MVQGVAIVVLWFSAMLWFAAIFVPLANGLAENSDAEAADISTPSSTILRWIRFGLFLPILAVYPSLLVYLLGLIFSVSGSIMSEWGPGARVAFLFSPLFLWFLVGIPILVSFANARPNLFSISGFIPSALLCLGLTFISLNVAATIAGISVSMNDELALSFVHFFAEH